MSVAVNNAVEEQRQKDKLESAKENKVETAIFELIRTRPSGFIKEGTERLPEPIEIAYPSVYRILKKSAILDPKAKGKRVVTRHILGVEEFRMDRQQDDMVNPETDNIIFKNGRLVVSNEGREASIFHFMRYGDSRNETNPNRIPGTTAVYREIFPEKEVEADNDIIFLRGEAVNYVRERVVAGKNSKGVQYNSDQLNALCRLFNVSGATDGERAGALAATAEAYPKEFLQKARAFEQTIFTEIAHGETLNLISFGDTEVSYVGKNKVITTFSSKLDKEKKINALANYFMSAEGTFDYKEYLIELDNKKNENI